MATKKTGLRRKSAKGKKKLTLGIVSKNQREINGMIFKALQQITIQLSGVGTSQQRSLGGPAKQDVLAELKEYVKKIPGFDPPGCNTGQPAGGGGNT
jgi:hypothetical protein